ncbi:MAG TPA: beta-propeller fold lactonase family protein [Nocardioidaceae bacterium]|nr:beta-propeller fold lactonase family protein [Nocardioidaceae bacterium]
MASTNSLDGKAKSARRTRMAAGVVPLVVGLGMSAGAPAHAIIPNHAVDTVGAVQTGPRATTISSATVRRSGAVFAMTNVTGNNRIIQYKRAADGDLTRIGSIRTRGMGIGTDLDTQGSVRLSPNHRFLYATNAGSDSISVFSVRGAQLRFMQQVYAGDLPISLTVHGNLLYVLVGSVAGNGILGFRIASDGTLERLRRSFRLLSSPIAVPGQVQFSPDGRLLLVTQKTTNVKLSPKNAIDVFRVRSGGRPSLPRREPSAGLRPFSLEFRTKRQVVVAEAFNAAPRASAASLYRVSTNGNMEVRSSSVRNHQTDACWIVVTDDNKYAFTANFGSGTISSYRFTPTGRLRLKDGKAAFLGLLSQPVDLALSTRSRYLYLLLRGEGAVAAFAVGEHGNLRRMGVTRGGLPVNDGASGLAAY